MMEPLPPHHAHSALQREPDVSAAYASALQAFLASRGFHRSVAPPTLEAAFGRVPGRAFNALFSDAVAALGDPLLGLRFGSCIGGAGFGMLGLVVVTAPTLRETIGQLQRFEPLTSTLGRTELHLGRELMSLVWLPATALPAATVDAAMAGWVSFGRYLIGLDADVVEVTFTHAAQASVADYEHLLACPVRFGAAYNCVRFSGSLLDARLRAADAPLNASLAAWLEPCAAVLDGPARGSLAARVATLLGDGMALQHASAGAIADRMHMSERTLQRRLADEGASFRRLLDGARAQHAITRLFRGGTSLSDIGAEIGFDEQSSLNRAFRRWTSHSPLELKRQLAPMFSELRSGRMPSPP